MEFSKGQTIYGIRGILNLTYEILNWNWGLVPGSKFRAIVVNVVIRHKAAHIVLRMLSLLTL